MRDAAAKRYSATREGGKSSGVLNAGNTGPAMDNAPGGQAQQAAGYRAPGASDGDVYDRTEPRPLQ